MRKKLLWILTLLITVCALGLTACGIKSDFDSTGYLKVEYNALGGTIGGVPTRTLFASENSILTEPNGKTGATTNNLEKPIRAGYHVEGWYTAITSDAVENENGDFVYVMSYLKDKEGAFISVPVYVIRTDLTSDAAEAKKTECYIAKFVKDSKGNKVVATDEDVKNFADYVEDNGTKYRVIFEKYYSDSDDHTNSDGEFVNGIYNKNDYFSEIKTVDGKEITTAYKYAFYRKYLSYDETNPKHKSFDRYKEYKKEYVTFDKFDPLHNGETRYDVTFTFNEKDLWNFKTDRITADKLDPITEKLTLYCSWAKDLQVIWVMNGTEVPYDNSTSYPIKQGEKILNKSSEPTSSELGGNKTFIAWSADKSTKVGETEKYWNFDNDTFPTDSTELKLYAVTLEGVYKKVSKADDLKSLSESSNYLLMNDIDMAGAENPFFAKSTFVFKGSFKGLEKYKIFNFTIDVGKNGRLGLFNTVLGASFTDVEFDYTLKNSGTAAVKTGSLAAEAQGIKESDKKDESITLNGLTVKVTVIGENVTLADDMADGAVTHLFGTRDYTVLVKVTDDLGNTVIVQEKRTALVISDKVTVVIN